MKIINLRTVLIQCVLLFSIFPLFINLDISNGLRFDANPYNYLGLPSIPISLLVLTILSFFYINKILFKKDLLIFLVFMILFLFLNFFNGSLIRSAIVFFGMLIPIFSFYVFLNFFKTSNAYNLLYNSLIITLFIKLISDIIFFRTLLSPNFLLEDVFIYNYYDYFPFFYYIIVVLSIYNIMNRYKIIISLFSIIIIYLLLFSLDSRLYQIGLVLLPFNILIYISIKLKLSIFYNIILCMVIIITLLVSLLGYIPNEISLAERFSHWIHYFDSFSLVNFFFPFFNEYRIGYAKSGTLHNEILEQFSYFGILVFYYYFFLIKKIFIDVRQSFKLSSYLIMFILIIGMLIQSNFSNPYIGVLLGLIMAILNKNLYNKEYL